MTILYKVKEAHYNAFAHQGLRLVRSAERPFRSLCSKWNKISGLQFPITGGLVFWLLPFIVVAFQAVNRQAI